MKKSIKISSFLMLTLGISAALATFNVRVFASGGTVYHVSDWNSLKSTIKNTSNGDSIILDADIKSSGDSDDRLKIDGRNITIDLNGHIVDRNRSKSTSNGHAFEIQGSSNVKIINSANNIAVIKGGYAENGGAVNIHDGSSVLFENIQFTGNKATDGGAILNRGYLSMNNCIISGNEASSTGGAIFNTDDGYFDLDSLTITDNKAKDEGGAFRIHLDKNSTIKNSEIKNNESKDDDGGAISLDEGGKVLSIYDTIISDNKCKDNGGAIDVDDGSIKLYGVTIRNNSAKKGGAVYFDGGSDDVFEIAEYQNNTIFEDNKASDKGGAIYNNDSDIVFNNGRFISNVTKNDGGALYLDDGKVTLNNTVFEKNKTEYNSGGAIYINDGDLNINGATFRNNAAASEGGAILFDEDSNNIKIQGAIIAEFNTAGAGNDFYLQDGKYLNVVGSLEGSYIGILKYLRTGEIARGYSDHNTVDPSNYFFTYSISTGATLDGNKVVLKDGVKGNVESSFISYDNGVDLRRIAGNNWMAGIDGERTLNEINIPGTHDTAMRNIVNEAGIGSTANAGAKYARTQYRYVHEQYEEGVRYVDIRLHNRHVREHWWRPNELIDDGENLWQTHGKTLGGTYWAGDENDNEMNVNMVLDWTRDFLTRNPSECIIMGFTEETYRTNENPEIRERLFNIVKKWIQDNPVNPATGKPYIYLEDGDIEKTYTFMPKLKDVRGMILLETGDDWQLGGFRGYGKAGMSTTGQKTDRLVWWDAKRDDVNSFFANPDHQITLPKPGEEWDHKNTLFKIGLNCAPQNKTTTLPQETPLYHSDRLLPELFFNPEGCFYDIKGKYVGWVKTDGAIGREWSKIWRSNYWLDEEDVSTITVNPNLTDDNYKQQQYQVNKNTEITVPDFNYFYEERTNNNYFQGWRVGNDIYKPGDKFTVQGDTTFVAVWSDAEMTRDVNINVVFKDCNDVDEIRPTSIDFKVNGTDTITIDDAHNWNYTYSGIVQTITPVGDYSADTATGYRYDLVGDVKNGFTLTFTHTRAENYTAYPVSINWIDEDNFENLRPGANELTIALVNLTTGVEVATHTFDGTDWTYDFGIEIPVYSDGKPINYRFVIKDTSTWAHKDEYRISQVLNIINAFHEVTKTNLMVNIRWVDDGTTRPTSVDVHILKGDTDIHTLSVTEIEDEELGIKEWHNSYIVDAYEEEAGVRKEIDYTISVDVAGYVATITETAVDCFDILLVAAGQEARAANVDAVIDLIDEIGTVEYTKACIDRIQAARDAFDALSEEDQDLVYNIFVLVSAEREFEQKFAHLVEIDEKTLDICDNLYVSTQHDRVNALNKLSREVIDLVTEERNMLFNVQVLNESLIKVASWQIVTDKINAINDVYSDDETKARIDAAKDAYAALTEDEKVLIENYNDLVSAQAEYFAKCFLEDVESKLAVPGASEDVAGALVEIWNKNEEPNGSSFNEKWDDLIAGARQLLNESESEESFVEFRSKYIDIMEDNSDTLNPFTNGPKFTVTPKSSSSSSNLPYIIALIVAGVLIIVSGFVALFIHRRKQMH